MSGSSVARHELKSPRSKRRFELLPDDGGFEQDAYAIESRANVLATKKHKKLKNQQDLFELFVLLCGRNRLLRQSVRRPRKKARFKRAFR